MFSIRLAGPAVLDSRWSRTFLKKVAVHWAQYNPDMDWYRTSGLVKRAKHASDHSHWCHLCGGDLKPVEITKNRRHHFPWGMEHRCGCGKSGIWTNSIRNDVEFVEGITGIRHHHLAHGFCNDLFCPFCYNWILPLKTPGIFVKDTHEVARYNRDDQVYRSEESGDVVNPRGLEFLDVYGCRSQEHNTDIVWRGYEDEYAEGEYEPIYQEYFKMRGAIPDELEYELRKAWEKAGKERFPL